MGAQGSQLATPAKIIVTTIFAGKVKLLFLSGPDYQHQSSRNE